MASIKDIVDEARLTAAKEAKKVVIQTIQRTATESAIEKHRIHLQYRER